VFSLVPLLGVVLIGNVFAQTKIPACPAGSQTEKWQDKAKPYIHFDCKLPEKINNMAMCREWEGTYWNTKVAVPCGSRVSSAVEYTGSLRCPVSQQVYLWDSSTKSLSKEISCLPAGWKSIQMTMHGCPSGYIPGTPALFGQDDCYRPRPSSSDQIAKQREDIQRDDLLARNINGYSLDMTVQQVQAVAHESLRSIGAGQYLVTANGIDYDFGFSVLGHLYRIDSKQILGRFIPDEAFARILTKKLSDKFGPPQTNQLPGGPAFWQYVEPYREAGGPVSNRITVSLSALLLGGSGQPISLNMKLMDFRIMRRDLARANAGPRSNAEDNTRF
jgi:hypothetical protein